MKIWMRLAVPMTAVVLISVLGLSERKAPAAISNEHAPVVVELFTSEGCSSCPPADALAAQLNDTQPVAGAYVIVLGQHVDYWNHLGWSDPFSSPQFSARQNTYASVFHTDQVYTPQMVVDGQTQFVGSDSSQALKAIREAAARPKAEVEIVPAYSQESNTVGLAFKVTKWGSEKPHGAVDITLAVTEDALHSQVRRGENTGRRLDHVGVVRQLRVIGSLSRASLPYGEQTKIHLSDQWNHDHLHIVIFLQDHLDRHILGAASVKLKA